MAKKSLKDIPLQEITLRKYEIPTALDYRELARKFLLSIGMLQPGDSRDIIVDVYFEILGRYKQASGATLEELERALEGRAGASSPNIRRQLRRLVAIKLIVKQEDKFMVSEGGNISEIINNYLDMFVVRPTVERIKQYAEALQNRIKD